MAVRLAAVETHKEAEENALLPVKQKQHPRFADCTLLCLLTCNIDRV